MIEQTLSLDGDSDPAVGIAVSLVERGAIRVSFGCYRGFDRALMALLALEVTIECFFSAA